MLGPYSTSVPGGGDATRQYLSMVNSVIMNVSDQRAQMFWTLVSKTQNRLNQNAEKHTGLEVSLVGCCRLVYQRLNGYYQITAQQLRGIRSTRKKK